MKKLYPEESVQAIADSIRSKTGKTDKMSVGEMSGEIEGIDLDRLLFEWVEGTITKVVIKNASAIPPSFYGQENIEALTIKSSSVCTLDDSLKINKGIQHIYVQEDLVEEYKNATNWTLFADYIMPISEVTY